MIAKKLPRNVDFFVRVCADEGVVASHCWR
jgi:hypothetical protein